MNITEAFAKKLAISEKVYSKQHDGVKMDGMKKVSIARVLANTAEYLNEAVAANSVGTQLADMGKWKKFCLDLTTVALPSLIANDLVLVWPMKSRTGFIQYLKFVAGSNKGGVNQGDVFNDVFKLGKMDEKRVNYTSAKVTDAIDTKGGTVDYRFAWTPSNSTRVYAYVDGEWTEVANNLLVKEGDVVVGVKATSFADGTKVAYEYDNVVIPQDDLPIVNAQVASISLEAKARRIAIYYSQMAAFQMKTEMGVDLGEVLATQACAELSYEIDTEVVNLLVENAHVYADMTFNKRIPLGVGIRDHYAGFAATIETGSQHIYDATQKHAANYMIASSSLKPLFVMMEGWKAASGAKINGPYFAGTLNGIKVYISPAITAGEYVLGYHGDDFTTSAAVYAPYMAIVPTQLLGYADGGMSEGFSTLYDLKILNDILLVKGKVVDEAREPDLTNKVVE